MIGGRLMNLARCVSVRKSARSSVEELLQTWMRQKQTAQSQKPTALDEGSSRIEMGAGGVVHGSVSWRYSIGLGRDERAVNIRYQCDLPLCLSMGSRRTCCALTVIVREATATKTLEPPSVLFFLLMRDETRYGRSSRRPDIRISYNIASVSARDCQLLS